VNRHSGVDSDSHLSGRSGPGERVEVRVEVWASCENPGDGHPAGFYGFLGGARPSTAAAHAAGSSTSDLRAIRRR